MLPNDHAFADDKRDRIERLTRLNGADYSVDVCRVCHDDGEPDPDVLRLHRRPPPELPLSVFGAEWRRWIEEAAEAAACPPDYVVTPLLSSASVLIGHARWAQATAGWDEPPHLWACSVGDSGNGKSPGGDCLFRDVLPEISGVCSAIFPTSSCNGAVRPKWQKRPRKAGN